MTDSSDPDGLEAEGVPDLVDAVNPDEGMYPPGDRPRFTQAVGVTPAEEVRGETLEERLRQEQPDRPAGFEHPVGRLVEAGDAEGGLDDQEVFVEETDDTVALSAEESAVHLDTRTY